MHACINININNGVYFLLGLFFLGLFFLGLFFRGLLSSRYQTVLTLDSFSSKLHWSTTYRSNNSYCLSVFLCFQTILGDMLREKKNLTPSILKIAPQKHLLYIMLIIASSRYNCYAKIPVKRIATIKCFCACSITLSAQ